MIKDWIVMRAARLLDTEIDMLNKQMEKDARCLKELLAEIRRQEKRLEDVKDSVNGWKRYIVQLEREYVRTLEKIAGIPAKKSKVVK